MLLTMGMLTLSAIQPASIEAGIPAPTDYRIIKQEANQNIWQRETYSQKPDGTLVTNTHSYVELASGLNHLVNGRWQASREQIDILPDGTVAATNGQHQAFFPVDIYNGTIQVITPDGEKLKSQPLGLFYDDGNHTVLIAVLTNSVGQLYGSNQAIYTNAFVGVHADIIYTYKKSGFEQDIVLRSRPPSPESLGLNPATARLQMMTEFFGANSPVEAAPFKNRQNGLTDQTLKFGKMKMVQGRAFSIGGQNNKSSRARGTPTYKSWIKIGGRTFLIETVPFQKIQPDLLQLQAAMPASHDLQAANSMLYKISDTRLVPPAHECTPPSEPGQFARMELPPEKGLVLDYLALNNYYASGDYTFQSNQTYYVSGYCEIEGTLTIQGGTVVKYAHDADLYVGGVTCQTGPFNLATLTAKDDDTVGQTIAGSTGTPSGYYAASALDFGNSDNVEALPSLRNLRICYAAVAIYNPGADIGFDLLNSQLIQCDIGVLTVWMNSTYKPNFSIRNVLMDQIGSAAFDGEPFDALMENVTVSGVNGGTACLVSVNDDVENYNVGLVNCLGLNTIYWGFTNYWGGGGASLNGTCCYSNLDSSAFQTVGAGNYYLANNSPYRNAGTANVDGVWVNGPALLPYLRQMTTYPPNVISGSFSANTVLYPRVQRDTDAVDAGYHYDTLDYLAYGLTVNSGVLLTLTNGVAVGVAGDVTLNGGLFAPMRFTNAVVQEQPASPINVLVGALTLNITWDGDGDGLPNWWELMWFGNLRQTAANTDANGHTLLYDYLNGLNPDVIQFSSIDVTNNYVNSSSAPAQLAVSGFPYYFAVSVDDTNYAADAEWNIYTSSNITINLGSTEGWHEVWIGLRSYTDPTNAAVWQWKRLKLDTTPPEIVITNPMVAGGAAATVDVPLIQLSGYSPEDLDHISCDVSNALGVVTNLDAGVTDRYHDASTWEFTTNHFECLDIDLTNGLNLITVHATDLAGNETITNFSFTLDYASKTNPPVVQITWPQDGTKVAGDSFTLDGFVNDPTVTVTAQMISSDGTTNTVNGLVERNGRYWVENLPLASGANNLTLTMADAVGNTSVTNIRVIQSALTLAMNPVVPDSDLWKSKVNLTGVISDPNQAVWVNGVKGHNNGDGTWYANDVPTSPGGVASFTIIGYEPDEPQPDGSYGNP